MTTQAERIDVVEEVALNLAQILAQPKEKDPQKRAEQREKALATLLRSISSLSAMARAAEEYAQVLEVSTGCRHGPDSGADEIEPSRPTNGRPEPTLPQSAVVPRNG
jgi:hypothetical protein